METKQINTKRIIFIFVAIVVIVCAIIFGSTGNKYQKNYDLGIKYLEQGDYENAAICLETALEIEKNKETYSLLANVYHKLNNNERVSLIIQEMKNEYGDSDPLVIASDILYAETKYEISKSIVNEITIDNISLDSLTFDNLKEIIEENTNFPTKVSIIGEDESIYGPNNWQKRLDVAKNDTDAVDFSFENMIGQYSWYEGIHGFNSISGIYTYIGDSYAEWLDSMGQYDLKEDYIEFCNMFSKVVRFGGKLTGEELSFIEIIEKYASSMHAINETESIGSDKATIQRRGTNISIKYSPDWYEQHIDIMIDDKYVITEISIERIAWVGYK